MDRTPDQSMRGAGVESRYGALVFGQGEFRRNDTKVLARYLFLGYRSGRWIPAFAGIHRLNGNRPAQRVSETQDVPALRLGYHRAFVCPVAQCRNRVPTPVRNRSVSACPARPCADAARAGAESRRRSRDRSLDQARRLHRSRARGQQGAPARVLPRRGGAERRRHRAHHRRGAVQLRLPRRGRRAQARHGYPRAARGARD